MCDEDDWKSFYVVVAGLLLAGLLLIAAFGGSMRGSRGDERLFRVQSDELTRNSTISSLLPGYSEQCVELKDGKCAAVALIRIVG